MRESPYSKTTRPPARPRAGHRTSQHGHWGIGALHTLDTLGPGASLGNQCRRRWARMRITTYHASPLTRSWAENPISMGFGIDARLRLEGYACRVGRPSPKPGYANARPLRQQPHSLWGCCGCSFSLVESLFAAEVSFLGFSFFCLFISQRKSAYFLCALASLCRYKVPGTCVVTYYRWNLMLRTYKYDMSIS